MWHLLRSILRSPIAPMKGSDRKQNLEVEADEGDPNKSFDEGEPDKNVDEGAVTVTVEMVSTTHQLSPGKTSPKSAGKSPDQNFLLTHDTTSGSKSKPQTPRMGEQSQRSWTKRSSWVKIFTPKLSG